MALVLKLPQPIKDGRRLGHELTIMTEKGLCTLNFRQDTTTSPLGVIIGTFSHTMPLSTSITSPEAGKKQTKKRVKGIQEVRKCS